MVFGEMVLVFGAGMLAGFVVAYAKALRYWKSKVSTPSESHNISSPKSAPEIIVEQYCLNVKRA